ncbi:MAG TPA: helix-turn-helix domain-containing protein, partial [Clostridia bacterium]|nr:helix-turn-helix domain-containing protein [Clostridia bacterium]
IINGGLYSVERHDTSKRREDNMFKVFLVEDEIVVREGIRKNIPWEQYGFIYTGDASDGELALPMIRQIQPDLLITDIKMPFMDGLALIELVRKELPRTKILIVSGYDDFSYAQQAIRMGVEQYLLKPVVKGKMVEILIALQKKMEAEQQQQEYLAVFQREVQEYEMFSRRRFFEQIVTGGLSVLEISETAKTIGVDVNAPFYNIVLFSLNSAGYDRSAPESYTDELAAIQDKIMQFIVSHPELILFRWDITTYAVLVKGEQDDIVQRTDDCIENIRSRCAMAGCDVNWHIAHGTPVSRLGAIPVCFTEASRVLSYRYICPEEHILTKEQIRDFQKKNGSEMDPGKKEIDQECIRNFLSNGAGEEIERFIDQLLQSAGEEAVSLSLFCRYLTMTIYFAVVKYLDSIGCRTDSFWSLELRPNDNLSTPEEARQYAHQLMGQAIELRDREGKKQQRDMLTQAIGFIDEHYQEETISLDRVARKVNVSPNYFSAIFSQEVGQTFIEYLTGKRIDEAKRLLRLTDKRSSEIAFAVGYKDPHYFSFAFKKISGCTPSEYRKGNKQ